jgi:hypothetical protein
LVLDPKAQHEAGWCTYTYEHEQAPELEVLCGGINSKTPRAGAIWRQGNLLHFGFECSPAKMNETGQALLINSIAYIARFTEDRPIVRTPCVFVQGTRLFDRDAIARRLEESDADLSALQYYIAKQTYEALKGKSRAEMQEWFKQTRDYLHADATGPLTVDADAQSFKVPPATIRFIEETSSALSDPGRAVLARRLLNRYAPDGPGKDATRELWESWLSKNRTCLFFSDTGGYRWYVDPLAKSRGVSTASLRGAARATLASAERTSSPAHARPTAGRAGPGSGH